MSHDAPLVIVLAAGLGTRMKSDTAKVLHQVAGRPLVIWPVELARQIGARKIVVVLGHQREQVAAVLAKRFGDGAVTIAVQAEQRGTGHAVAQALPALAGEPDASRVVILSGDVPLLGRETVDALLAAQANRALAVVTTHPPEARGYGRIVRDDAGYVQRIVEEKDASATEKQIAEVNAGIYSVALGFLREGVGALEPNNAQHELYLTDLVARAALRGEAATVQAPWDDVAGVNDRVELARLDGIARRRIAERWMRDGVTMKHPDTVSIDADVAAIGKDSELGARVELRGRVTIGAGVKVDTGCVITDATIGDGALVKPYCVIAESSVGARAQLGPFAHLRPGSELAEEVHVGNFVETKKARLGKGSKANHLSYLGDAVIGAKVNVGAGTITCNYDGVNKFVTTIEDGVFIGSDTQLVAPVTVGKEAYVGAGATITEDVPAGALAITRAPLVIKEGYVAKKREKQKQQKKP
jgi:bifunctional UDP-N-acetylglucosamine pyrophosphorylase/glucosamine-1-phosphate N-acetyltransferase